MCQVYLSLFYCICLPILMLLYLMPYIILAYLMLFAALFNAVCVMLIYFLRLQFVSMLCIFFIDTWLAYFKYYLASCTMLFITWFS